MLPRGCWPAQLHRARCSRPGQSRASHQGAFRCSMLERGRRTILAPSGRAQGAPSPPGGSSSKAKQALEEGQPGDDARSPLTCPGASPPPRRPRTRTGQPPPSACTAAGHNGRLGPPMLLLLLQAPRGFSLSCAPAWGEARRLQWAGGTPEDALLRPRPTNPLCNSDRGGAAETPALCRAKRSSQIGGGGLPRSRLDASRAHTHTHTRSTPPPPLPFPARRSASRHVQSAKEGGAGAGIATLPPLSEEEGKQQVALASPLTARFLQDRLLLGDGEERPRGARSHREEEEEEEAAGGRGPYDEGGAGAGRSGPSPRASLAGGGGVSGGAAANLARSTRLKSLWRTALFREGRAGPGRLSLPCAAADSGPGV